MTDENSVPTLPADPNTRPGDLFMLGEHRLLCGNSTNAADVQRLLDGAHPPLMVTDPPYGVDYDPAWRNRRGVSATTRVGRVANDDRADWHDAWALFPGDVAYVWCASLHVHEVADSLVAVGFELRASIIWAKSRLVLSQGHYHWQHEPCWYAVRKGASAHWQGTRDQSTLWSIPSSALEDAATRHGTQKPVEAMRRPMMNNSIRGDTVYDPFAGSGNHIGCSRDDRPDLPYDGAGRSLLRCDYQAVGGVYRKTGSSNGRTNSVICCCAAQRCCRSYFRVIHVASQPRQIIYARDVS